MLNTLKERLLDGMEIKKVKEKPSKYAVTFLVNGKEYMTEIPKACVPGMQNRVVDQSMFLVMCNAEVDKGNLQAGKLWLDKISESLSG